MPLATLAVAAASCAPAGVGAADTPASGPYSGELSLVVSVDAWPPVVDWGEVMGVRVSIRNEGKEPVHIEYGEDAARLRATPQMDLGNADLADVELPTGIVWVESFTALPFEVVAIGYGATVAPGESVALPPRDAPVTLGKGLYTVSACARIRTAAVASASEWCTDGLPLTVR